MLKRIFSTTAFILFVFLLAAFGSRPALAADSYTVNSSLRFNPHVSGAQLDAYIAGVYPDSPLVGLGQTWVKVGAKYNIDPVYLMSHGILESGWGFSWLSANKFNIYGWNAYDRDPEGMASPYTSYAQCIEAVASNINSMYLTPAGDYYTALGPTLRGMNTHYATSKTWAASIAELMNDFAATVPGYVFPPPFREYDASYAAVDVPNTIQPGTTHDFIVKVTNSGDAAWPAHGTWRLNYSVADSAGNTFSGGSIDMPAEVRSGTSILLDVQLQGPPTPGLYKAVFDIARTGATAYSAIGIAPLSLSFTAVSSNPYYQAAFNLAQPMADTVYSGTSLDTYAVISNLSPSTWPADLTTCGYQWIDADTGQIIAVNALAGRPSYYVFPGNTAQVPVKINVPERPGRYIFKSGLVDNGLAWFTSNGSPGLTSLVTVVRDFAVRYRLIGELGPLWAATPKGINIELTNTSRMTWNAHGAVRLAYSFSDGGGHEGYSTPLSLPRDVKPGETIVLPVTLSTPITAGARTLSFDLFYNGVGWFSQAGAAAGQFAAEPRWDMQVSYGEVETGTVSTGRYTSVRLKVTNTSRMTWPGGGRLRAGYRLGYKPGYEGFVEAAPVLTPVAPGQTTVIEFSISDPARNGVYNASFDLHLDDAGWFSQFGNTTPSHMLITGS